MKTRNIFLLLIVLVAILGGAYYYFIPSESQEQEDVVIGGDKDEHGCLIAAGYSWCEDKGKCLRLWEEACIDSARESIKEFLAKKYDKKVSEVTITITQETENHAKGSVVFQPGGSGNSGLFLAAKINDEWEVVFDGNGAPDCVNLESYNFPQEMLQNICY